VPGSGFAQASLSHERQVAVAGVVFDRLMTGQDGCAGRRDVGVHIFQAEDVRIMGGIGGIAHAVDADSGNVLEAGDGHERDFLQVSLFN